MIKEVRRQSIEFENAEANIFLPSAYGINYLYLPDANITYRHYTSV
jgi:hypothetical protein